MSVRALVGLGAFNLVVLAAGCALLWGIRGLRTWGELARFFGLAYMLGVAALGIALSIELVVGVPFSYATVMVTVAALAVAGLGLGRAVRRPLPRRSREHGQGTAAVAVAYAGILVVYLEALFRAGRLQALTAWDAWAFWVPKAKAIYFLGGLDEQFFREIVNASYPPLLPALHASSFAFMGSADVVTLHLQHWFFAVGFVAAAVGLLAPRVHPLLLWPFVLAALVAPRIVRRSLEPQADFLLDYFFALAALLVVLWLEVRRPWLLVSATLFLAAAMLTKREGQLLAACVLVAALAVSWRSRRYAWPRLAAAGAVGIALALPWRVWFTSRDLPGDVPTAGFLGIFDHLDRAWPSLESTLRAAFDPTLWLAVPFVTVLAILLAFVGGARALPSYVALVHALAIAGFTWVLWSSVELDLPFVQDEGVNPIVRLSGSLVVLSVCTTPLLLDAAWRGKDDCRRGDL